MRITYISIYMSIGLLLCLQPFYANAVTLKQAMDRAVEAHPRLAISNAQIDVAQDEFSELSAYAYNPELSVEPQRRQLNAGGTSNDYYVSLSQEVELAGKQAYRTASAHASSQAVSLSSEMLRQKIKIDVAKALVELYFSQKELAWRNQQAITLRALNRSIARQLEVGEANQLDMNLSRSSLKQTIHAEAQSKMQYSMHLYKYFMAAGKRADMNTIQAELPELSLDWKPSSDPVEIAMDSRLDIAVKQQRLNKFSSDVNLAKANKLPDMKVGFMAGREAGEQIYSLALTMPIPVLNSHNGAYRAALSQRSAQQAEFRWLKQQVKFEVDHALHRHDIAINAIEAANQTDGEISAGSQDTITLARMAFDAGELDVEELVVHINQALESRINSAAILKQGWLARIHLAAVLGHPEYIYEGNRQ